VVSKESLHWHPGACGVGANSNGNVASSLRLMTIKLKEYFLNIPLPLQNK
jgi:hypothetical protein